MKRQARKDGRDPLIKYQRMRRPGQSLQERCFDLVFDGYMMWACIAVASLGIFIIELGQWLFDSRPQPGVYFLFFIVLTAIAIWKYRQATPQLESIHQGYRGEQMVGQLLEDLRVDGYQIFHDLDGGPGGNIDHVVLGPAGVFAIETKTYTKPAKREARIRYDGRKLQIDGRNPADFGQRDPLNQAQTAARRVHEIIQGCTGKSCFVKPVLLFPGWWVTEPRGDVAIWVLNPDRFIVRLRHEPVRLKPEQICMLAANLRRTLKQEPVE